PTAGTLTLTVAGTVQYAQLEAGSFATSFIPTAGATVTRNADVLTYLPSGNVDATVGTAYVECQIPGSDGATNNYVLSSATNNTGLIYRRVASTDVSLFDGTTEVHGGSWSL